MQYLKEGKDVLVYAACGAGKTELTMEAIQWYLCQGKKVGFAISRRQVVLEIQERMQQAFPMLQVIAVCEGFTDITDGDLIICTMHQLYRYHGWFDLLIMDEVDAFPYRDNALLEAIAMHACIGQKLMLTALSLIHISFDNDAAGSGCHKVCIRDMIAVKDLFQDGDIGGICQGDGNILSLHLMA